MPSKIVAVVAMGAAHLASATDACFGVLLGLLRTALHMKYLGYRLPAESDNENSVSAWNKKQGGSGYVGATSGDFGVSAGFWPTSFPLFHGVWLHEVFMSYSLVVHRSVIVVRPTPVGGTRRNVQHDVHLPTL